MDQLIAKYLQGNLTLEEQHELSKWIQSDERNAKTLQKLEIYWKDHQSDLMVEELEVRKRLLQRMKEEERVDKKPINYRYFLKVAAILVFVFSISLIVAQINFNEPVKSTSVALVEKVSLPGQKISTLLPDGTIVKLNTDSKIITPAQFSENSREVTLIGEAFFDVKRDESRPFTIKTASMEVTVLGTSFSVSAYEDEEEQSVAVKTGKVSVKDFKDESSIELDPLQMSVLSNKGFVKSEISNPQEAFGWVNQQMVFDNQSIHEVLKEISKWYGKEIEINIELSEDKKYTASYDNPSLVEVMDILAFVYGFEYENEKGRIIIK